MKNIFAYIYSQFKLSFTSYHRSTNFNPKFIKLINKIHLTCPHTAIKTQSKRYKQELLQFLKIIEVLEYFLQYFIKKQNGVALKKLRQIFVITKIYSLADTAEQAIVNLGQYRGNCEMQLIRVCLCLQRMFWFSNLYFLPNQVWLSQISERSTKQQYTGLSLLTTQVLSGQSFLHKISNQSHFHTLEQLRHSTQNDEGKQLISNIVKFFRQVKQMKYELPYKFHESLEQMLQMKKTIFIDRKAFEINELVKDQNFKELDNYHSIRDLLNFFQDAYSHSNHYFLFLQHILMSSRSDNIIVFDQALRRYLKYLKTQLTSPTTLKFQLRKSQYILIIHAKTLIIVLNNLRKRKNFALSSFTLQNIQSYSQRIKGLALLLQQYQNNPQHNCFSYCVSVSIKYMISGPQSCLKNMEGVAVQQFVNKLFQIRHSRFEVGILIEIVRAICQIQKWSGCNFEMFLGRLISKAKQKINNFDLTPFTYLYSYMMEAKKKSPQQLLSSIFSFVVERRQRLRRGYDKTMQQRTFKRLYWQQISPLFRKQNIEQSEKIIGTQNITIQQIQQFPLLGIFVSFIQSIKLRSHANINYCQDDPSSLQAILRSLRLISVAVSVITDIKLQKQQILKIYAIYLQLLNKTIVTERKLYVFSRRVFRAVVGYCDLGLFLQMWDKVMDMSKSLTRKRHRLMHSYTMARIQRYEEIAIKVV